ncbi:DUF2783 domain-containing protein [Oceanibacterium hippocampi]|nr:DUF2783 domain-containing protein [Oceanibacterium hippocampi]
MSSSALILDANLDDPDRFYAALVESCRDLPPEEALAFSARLILLLANHVGDHAILAEALRLAAAGEPAA